MAANKRLRVGELVRHDGRVWRVDLVNPCRARIAPVSRRHVSYRALTGDLVEFDAADGRPLSICPDAEVERVDPAELEEDMATKKEPKSKAPRAPKVAAGDLCTFAIRIPRAEAAAIHKAAGPGKATSWARAVLAAAAKGE